MGVSLSKGGNVSLSKEAPGLTSMTVGLGWDVRATDGADFDLDAVIFVTGEDGKVRSDADFIFYNNKTGAGVEHLGDNRTGKGETCTSRENKSQGTGQASQNGFATGGQSQGCSKGTSQTQSRSTEVGRETGKGH